MDDRTNSRDMRPERQAQEYRLYFLDPNGHIRRRLDLICGDDAQAVSAAAAHAEGRAMELWERDRHVMDFPASRVVGSPARETS